MSDPEHIRNFQRLAPHRTTSGRLRDEDLDALAAIGTRHVINLALDEHPEALAGEAEKLAARGIGYTHIPVPFDAPTEDHYRAFVAALETAGGEPVHVHCIMNYRVSAFFYRYHRERLGMAEAEARGLLERQWAPQRSDRPEAQPWARFLNGIGG
ncbi:MAG TPA: protein tyrosine phosphatase family protein [Novosphingobium sp.]|nr:protein tyrosine phosphatase family protein [Novosphingobium sp.]